LNKTAEKGGGDDSLVGFWWRLRWRWRLDFGGGGGFKTLSRFGSFESFARLSTF
jgi:hypothetical protein